MKNKIILIAVSFLIVNALLSEDKELWNPTALCLLYVMDFYPGEGPGIKQKILLWINNLLNDWFSKVFLHLDGFYRAAFFTEPAANAVLNFVQDGISIVIFIQSDFVHADAACRADLLADTAGHTNRIIKQRCFFRHGAPAPLLFCPVPVLQGFRPGAPLCSHPSRSVSSAGASCLQWADFSPSKVLLVKEGDQPNVY